MIKEEIYNKEDIDEATEKVQNLILYNDDFNTFDFVIDTLIKVCEHEPEQAEQCTLIVHFKGKCAVKSGTLNELKTIHRTMSDRNLTVDIA